VKICSVVGTVFLVEEAVVSAFVGLNQPFFSNLRCYLHFGRMLDEVRTIFFWRLFLAEEETLVGFPLVMAFLRT